MNSLRIVVLRSRCITCVPPHAPPSTPSFADVPTDYWAYKHIEYCEAHQIVNGYDGDYRPESAVTRDQMAVYIARAFVPSG